MTPKSGLFNKKRKKFQRILRDARKPDLLDRSTSGSRVNLSRSRRLSRLPWPAFGKAAAIVAAVWFFALGSAFAPTPSTFGQSSGGGVQDKASERAALEAQLAALEKEMAGYQSQIASYQKQGKSLSTEVAKLNTQVAALNTQIKAVDLTLSQLGGQITATQAKIGDLEVNIDENQDRLGGLLQQMYENESASMLEVLLSNPRLSDFFNDLNSYTLLQGSVHDTIDQISTLRDQLVDQKHELTQAKEDAQTIKNFRLTQASQVSATKAQKNQLLAQTKGQESKYQEILKETQKTAAQIRNRLFELLGGGSMSFEQAYQLAKIAGSATGVRPAFILAILDRESALGSNVGQCTYQTAMNPKDKPIFLDITSRLGLDPNSTKVSCANADGAYGGAMGPAQFIPSTWKAYEPRIKSATGKAAVSPWNNGDAFMAAALYVKDAGAATNERTAAAKYYCGANYNRYVCLSVYGAKVVAKAAQFQEDIAAIGG